MISFSQSWAQSSLKELSVNYNELRLDKGYTILYDNPNETAKLNEFKIKFYRDETYIDETAVENFPSNGTIVTYRLTNSIIGFNNAKLSIISLYSGDISDFPPSAASIIALNEPTEIGTTETAKEPINKSPIAFDILFEIEATDETLTRSIANQFSDPDGDVITVVEVSKKDSPLSYVLSPEGLLTLKAPSITGSYNFDYDVKDSREAVATAQISVNISLPESINETIDTKKASLEALKDKLTKLEIDIAKQPTMEPTLNDTLTKLAGEIERSIQLAENNEPIKSQLENLRHELDEGLSATTQQSLRLQLEGIQTQLTALDRELILIESNSQTDGIDIIDLTTSLDAFSSKIEPIGSQIYGLERSLAVTADQIAAWKARYQTLIDNSLAGIDWRWILGAAAFVFATFATMRIKGHTQHKKKNLTSAINLAQIGHLEKLDISKIETQLEIEASQTKDIERLKRILSGQLSPNIPLGIPGRVFEPIRDLPALKLGSNEGLIFEDSLSWPSSEEAIIMAGSASAPTHLPQSSGVEQSYRAVGRIGQSWVNDHSDESSYGTGILISPRHVVTNHHVYDAIKSELTGEDPWGIEFYAEKGNTQSEFIRFDGNHPVKLDGLDLVVFTLELSLTNRVPIAIENVETEDLLNKKISVIGYPSKIGLWPGDYIAFEEDPTFSVKRVSRGEIYRHQADEGPHGFEYDGGIPTICHNASTHGGNSGSPLIDESSGELLAIHYSGAGYINGVFEKTNLAMPISNIIGAMPEHILSEMQVERDPHHVLTH